MLVFGVLVSAMSLTGSVGTTALSLPLEVGKGVVKGPEEPSTFSLPTFPLVTFVVVLHKAANMTAEAAHRLSGEPAPSPLGSTIDQAAWLQVAKGSALSGWS